MFNLFLDRPLSDTYSGKIPAKPMETLTKPPVNETGRKHQVIPGKNGVTSRNVMTTACSTFVLFGKFDGVAKIHQLLRCCNCSRHCGVPEYASFLDNCAPCIWRFLLSHSLFLLSCERIKFGCRSKQDRRQGRIAVRMPWPRRERTGIRSERNSCEERPAGDFPQWGNTKLLPEIGKEIRRIDERRWFPARIRPDKGIHTGF